MKIAQLLGTIVMFLFCASSIYAETAPSYLDLSHYHDIVHRIENNDFNPPPKKQNDQNDQNDKHSDTKHSTAKTVVTHFYPGQNQTAKTAPSYLDLSHYHDTVHRIENNAFNPPPKKQNDKYSNVKYRTAESGFYFGGGAGVTYSNPGQSQVTVSLDSNPTTWTKEHAKNPGGNFGFLLNFGGGYELALKKDCFIDFGIALYMEHQYSTSGEYNSVVYGDGNHEYNYFYNVTSFIQPMIEAKFKIKVNRFLPFVSFGIGPSWIKAESYALVPVGVQTGYETATYPADRKARLAYQIGGGIEYQISNNNFLGLEYKYIYLGNVDFKNKNQEYPYKLYVGNIGTHNVMLNFVHRF
jgi:opacity protein-like surface antigen